MKNHDHWHCERCKHVEPVPKGLSGRRPCRFCGHLMPIESIPSAETKDYEVEVRYVERKVEV